MITSDVFLEAVHSGVGLASIHGVMGDAFRSNTDYKWRPVATSPATHTSATTR